MIAEKEATWVVTISTEGRNHSRPYGWVAHTLDEIGAYREKPSDILFKTGQEAISNFKEYAALNGIKNYKFVETE